MKTFEEKVPRLVAELHAHLKSEFRKLKTEMNFHRAQSWKFSLFSFHSLTGDSVMASKKKPIAPAANGDFESLVTTVVQMHHQAQDFATKAVNIGLTLRNWLIGWQIEEYQRNGADRASYGDKLMDTLAERLVQKGWKRCDRRELYRFRQLYLHYPRIVESLTPQSHLRPELQPVLSQMSSEDCNSASQSMSWRPFDIAHQPRKLYLPA